MDIINQVKEELMKYVDEHKNSREDHYDFWGEHIKYVYEEAIALAKKYNADEEIVQLGALLHDIALVKMVGTRAEHHINGKIIAEEILIKYQYPKEKMDRVLGCVYNHRSSKNATNIEEQCVADADVLAHFDNIPMVFSLAYKQKDNNTIADVREWLKYYFKKDFNDLSDVTKKEFEERYKLICRVILGEEL